MLHKRTFLLALLSSVALAQEPPKAELSPALMPASGAMTPGAPPPVPGGFTIALMPDTQYYAQLHPDIFDKQTQWIADNTTTHAIKFVIQLGDVTQTAAEPEWIVARDAFKRLEGKVPWASAPGNHDYGGALQIVARRTPFTTWMPLAVFQSMPSFGDVYDKQPDRTENQWHHFEAGGRKWLVIGLEFAPRADVLRWADEVVGAHPDHSTIIFTHAYLEPRTNQRIKLSASLGRAKNSKTQPAPKPDVTQGEDLWQRVASKHANVVLVVCGHACYTSHSASTGAAGNVVHEMVVDYQKDENGGNGWMRLLQFLPDGKTVRCRDFSPWIGQTCAMPDRTYDFELAAPVK